MKILSHRMLRTKSSTERSRCTDLHALEQFRTQGFLLIEFAAVQRCARKSTEFASGSKIFGENRGRTENSLIAQELRTEGSAEDSRCTCMCR